ncbi:Holliday junction resolvase RuvX [Candidatus Margulisiibacteriota bacterium]
MKILGIDYGTKRIGVAISDPLGIIANGLPTIDAEVALDKIKKIVQDERVTKIVLGYPKKMDGTIGPAAEAVDRFKLKLQEALELPITLWDERLTTAEATKRLIEADVSRAKRKQVVDKTAATLILQGYLDCKKIQ